ncbi:DNA-binding WRKY [Cynara cardunculus var. scolymus]|uniref:DNA-binding WRKY n=1 Tax=Cynara cardunculus var. scolymus TaxID=59895 RepID=A0A103YDR8_CYNCS|nr:DNA-binding WRKY [Cynara cardunculus var. scolymus]
MFPSLSHDPAGNPNYSLSFYNPLATNDDATYQYHFEDTLLDYNHHRLIDQPSYQGSTPLDLAPHLSISEQDPVLQEMTTTSTRAYQDSSSLNDQNPALQHMITAETVNVGSRIAFRVQTELEVVDDGYKWRKNYYHCAAIGCKVKKRIERDIDDPSYVITTYDLVHNHKRSS